MPTSDPARRVHGRLIFGADETRWSVPDPTDERWGEASHTARYSMQQLTQTQCYYLAELAELYHYLMVACPTTALAFEKVRAIRREVRRGK